jgi:hypothetical protein
MSITLAAACDDAAPADDVFVYALSSRQALALCDELRDAASVGDHPLLCQSGKTRWLLPSNEACASADLSACRVTAGELRRCLASALQAPCASASSETAPLECQRVAGCYPLLPTVASVEPPPCTPIAPTDLRSFEGIYEMPAGAASHAPSCAGDLPPVIDTGASHFVLVSTDSSGTPWVILQSCDSVADCQALAREAQATGGPRSTAPGGAPNNLLRACREDQAGEDHLEHDHVILQREATAGAACSTAEWWPWVQIQRLQSSLNVTISAFASPPHTPPGCGSAGFDETCSMLTGYDALLVAPL